MAHIDLSNLLSSLPGEVLTEEPLSRHTSFRVGGPAEIFVRPKTTEEIIQIRETCCKNNIPITILGDGTNVLVADAGLKGVVICTNRMNEIEVYENGSIRAQAGARLSRVAEMACRSCLTGFEFASGIPGTVGGAVYMNAGAYGHDIGEFCESVILFDNCIIKRSGAEMEFGYRKSFVQQNDVLILEALFKLKHGNENDIREKMNELNAKRRASQPVDIPSAGSTFKRPPGFYAGKLVQDSGFKGFSIGGAQVSEKHAGFVVNKGNATAQNIFDLIQAVRKGVHEKFDVWLTPEVRLLGFE